MRRDLRNAHQPTGLSSRRRLDASESGCVRIRRQRNAQGCSTFRNRSSETHKNANKFGAEGSETLNNICMFLAMASETMKERPTRRSRRIGNTQERIQFRSRRLRSAQKYRSGSIAIATCRLNASLYSSEMANTHKPCKLELLRCPKGQKYRPYLLYKRAGYT